MHLFQYEDKIKYFAPPGVEPKKYTHTILTYFKRYHHEVRAAQEEHGELMDWGSPVEARTEYEEAQLRMQRLQHVQQQPIPFVPQQPQISERERRYQ